MQKDHQMLQETSLTVLKGELSSPSNPMNLERIQKLVLVSTFKVCHFATLALQSEEIRVDWGLKVEAFSCLVIKYS